MPQPRKGARLWLRPARRDKETGAILEPARWIIRDGRNQISTGCGAGASSEAEKKLQEYLAAKHAPVRTERPLSQILIADVISVYLDDVVPGQARPAKAAERAERLIEFFGGRTLDKITGSLCREYAAWREGKGRSNKGTGGGARRDLQDLAAAINHHHREGLHREVVRVLLPARGEARQRWLTRSEVARLLWVCLTTREVQEGAQTSKRPLHHLTRFILIGVYTGSRPGAILGLSWHQEIGRGYVDLEHRLIYRLKEGAMATNKRQPPVPIAPELERAMRRWARQDNRHGPIVRFNGESVGSVKTALNRAVRLAGLDTGVTAYTLRHTTGSWLIQKSVSTRKVAEVLGTSEAMVEKHYGHLAPDHLRQEVAMIGRRG